MLWPFEYVSPGEPEDVSGLIAADGAIIFAGGTNVIVDMELGLIRPKRLVDVKRLEPCGLLDFDGELLSIGAAVAVNRLVEDLEHPFRCLRDAVSMMASYQVRNRATVAGNLCYASPAADLAPPLLVLGTKVHCMGSGGSRREIPLDEFFTGVKKNALEAGEWVVKLQVGPVPGDVRTAFFKRQRVRGHDLAVVNGAVACSPGKKLLRVAVGACAETPLLFDFDEAFRELSGTSLVGVVLDKVLDRISPIDDVRASAAYRRSMVEHHLRTTLSEVLTEKGVRS